MSSIDYRHARQDQGFVYGRLIALIEHLDELVAGEPASAPQQKLTLLALRYPARGLARMTARWSDLRRDARRRGTDIAALDEEWSAAVAVVTSDTEPLPDLLPDHPDDRLAAWGAAMVYGRAHETLSITGRQSEAARAREREWMERAKAAAIAAVAAGMSEVEAARQAGISRPTLRKALGK